MLRYLVERIADGVFLELELPILVDSSSSAFNGPGHFSGEVLAVADAYRFAGSDELIDPWATYIHEEADGVIRGTWIVTRSSFEEWSWKIEAQGVSSFFSGCPYTGEYRGVRVSPVEVARHVITHAQAQVGGNIGVTVRGMSDLRVGTDSDLKADAAKADYDAKKKALKVVSDKRKAKLAEIKTRAAPFDKQIKQLEKEAKPLRAAYQALIDARKPLMDAYKALTKQREARTDVYDAAVKAKRPAGEIAAAKAAVDALKTPIENAKALVDARKPAIDAAKVPLDAKNAQIKLKRAEKVVACEPLQTQYDALKEQEEPLKKPVEAAKDVYDKAKEKLSEDGGAWKILWPDTPDVLDSFQDAVDAAGQEWFERSYWNADRTAVVKELVIVPRVGRVQDNLAFIEGDNITEAVVVEADGSQYANAVVAIGAGEGREALRVSLAVSDSRRRRVAVVDAKEVTSKPVLERLARAELDQRMRRYRAAGVRVVDHPNAEFGAFGPGDTITVECDVPWIGRQALRHRITEVERVSEDIVDLILGDA